MHSVCPEPCLGLTGEASHAMFHLLSQFGTGVQGPSWSHGNNGKEFSSWICSDLLGQKLSAESPQHSFRILVLILSLEPDLGIKICCSAVRSACQGAGPRLHWYPGVSPAHPHPREAGGVPLGWAEARRRAVFALGLKKTDTINRY